MAVDYNAERAIRISTMVPEGRVPEVLGLLNAIGLGEAVTIEAPATCEVQYNPELVKMLRDDSDDVVPVVMFGTMMQFAADRDIPSYLATRFIGQLGASSREAHSYYRAAAGGGKIMGARADRLELFTQRLAVGHDRMLHVGKETIEKFLVPLCGELIVKQ